MHTIYLNTAAAGLVSDDTLQACVQHLAAEQALGAYVAQNRQQTNLNSLGPLAARLLNCLSHEIAFTDSGTRAWHKALESVGLQQGDSVLVSPGVWGGHYYTLLQFARQLGVIIKPMPQLADGSIDLDRLAGCLDPTVKLIELCHAPSGWDVWQPLEPVIQLANRHGIPVLVDACQSVGQRPLNVGELGCDLLVCSGRKWLRGPRGTGILFASQQWCRQHLPLYLGQHQAEFAKGELALPHVASQFELAECSVAARMGLLNALHEACGHFENHAYSQQLELAHWFRTELNAVRGCIAPDFSTVPLERLGAIVTFTHTSQSAENVVQHLRSYGIETAHHPASYMPLHGPTQLRGDCIRISVSAVVSHETLEHTLTALRALAI